MRVAAGFEAAIGALFEDELFAPLGADAAADAACFWVDLGAFDAAPALPPGAHPMAEAATVPAALGRSLAQAGWVGSEADGRRLQRQLTPGQRLVDRDGRLWRWDGFTRYAAGPSAAAQHLGHRNRRAELSGEIAAAAAVAHSAAAEAGAATGALRESADSERQARAQLAEAEAALARARGAEAEIARRALTAQAQLAALDDRLEKIALDLAEAQAEAEETGRAVAALSGPSAPAAPALEMARAAAIQARREEAEARAEAEGLAGAARSQGDRLASIDLEERSWRQRAAGSMAQRGSLAERQGALDREIAAMALRPAAIAADTAALGGRIWASAQNCRHSADRLTRGESQLRQAIESSRLADQALAEARERRARLEVQSDGAKAALSLSPAISASGSIPSRRRSPISPASPMGAAPAEASAVEARLAKLARERDGVGPVNLVAESEAGEIGARVAALERERADLTEAITRLRRGAAVLDQEGRAAPLGRVRAGQPAFRRRCSPGCSAAARRSWP